MSARRSALGRGLGALIPGSDGADRLRGESAPTRGSRATDVTALEESPSQAPPANGAQTSSGPQMLPVSKIDANPDQPRRRFDPAQLKQLAESIVAHGVLQPVVVRRAGDRYQLVVGERRWRASRAAGHEEIPAVVADVDSDSLLEIAIVENVQRHDLNPMELAHAYRALADAGHTQAEIGRKVSMDRSSVANHLRLLELARDQQEDLESDRLSMGHAKALLQIQNPERRRHVRNRIVGEGLSVRATEQLARAASGAPPTKSSTRPRAEAPLDPDLAGVVDAIQRRFQARVALKSRGKGGKVEIEYAGSEDLGRITSLLLGRDQ